MANADISFCRHGTGAEELTLRTAVLKIFVGGTTLDTSGIAKKAAVRRQASCSRLGRQSLMPGSLLIGHENM